MIQFYLRNVAYATGIVHRGDKVLLYAEYNNKPDRHLYPEDHPQVYAFKAAAVDILRTPSAARWSRPADTVEGVAAGQVVLHVHDQLHYLDYQSTHRNLVVPAVNQRIEGIYEIGVVRVNSGYWWGLRTTFAQPDPTIVYEGLMGGLHHVAIQRHADGRRDGLKLIQFHPQAILMMTDAVARKGRNERIYVHTRDASLRYHLLYAVWFDGQPWCNTAELAGPLDAFDEVTDIDVSPDGTTLAVAARRTTGRAMDTTLAGEALYHRRVMLFDVSSAGNARYLRTYEFSAERVSFSPDGYTLAVLGCSKERQFARKDMLTLIDMET